MVEVNIVGEDKRKSLCKKKRALSKVTFNDC